MNSIIVNVKTDEVTLVEIDNIDIELTTEQQKQNILNELSELDKIIPRPLEDVIRYGTGFVYEDNQAILDKKAELRNELKTL